MKKTFLSLALVALNIPLALAACSSSSSSGGGGSGSVTTLDSSKQAGSLSDAEKTQYCKDVNAYNAAAISEADTKKVACFSAVASTIFLGGTPPKDDAELRSKCKTAYQECLAKPVEKADAGATVDDCKDAVKDLANCTATVGELNTCVADRAAAGKSYFAKVDSACDGLSLDGGSGLDKELEDPASCKAVEAKCPNL